MRQKHPTFEVPPGLERFMANLDETARFVAGGREVREEMIKSDPELAANVERAAGTLKVEVGKIGDIPFSQLVENVSPLERAILHAARGTVTKGEQKTRKDARAYEEEQRGRGM